MSSSGAPLRVQFIKYETIGDHTEYFIQVSDNEQTWTVTCRYSRLAEVHSALKTVNAKLPDFPPKKMFGSTNPQFISKRMSSLQHYVITLVNGGDKFKIKPLMDLLMSGSSVWFTRKSSANSKV